MGCAPAPLAGVKKDAGRREGEEDGFDRASRLGRDDHPGLLSVAPAAFTAATRYW